MRRSAEGELNERANAALNAAFDAEMREVGLGAAEELKEGAEELKERAIPTDAALKADAGTRFTCCTSASTEVQILTQSAQIMQVLDLLAVLVLVQKYKY